jgi:DNA-binding NtrC family response regulator
MSDSNRPTIAIVDDEEMVAGALRGFLELETPYRVLGFTSPTAALERMAQEPVHVVLADFMMPEMDGITLLRHVRERFPNVTRILLTGYADKQDAIRAINEVGLYHYLEKPWSNDQLRLVVRNAVERSTLVNELDARISALEVANHDLLELRRRIVKAFL